MATPIELEPFVYSPDDPLADAHFTLAGWLEDPGNSHDGNASYGEKVDSLPTGQRLLKAKPAERRRYLLAAVAQVRHWDKYGYYHMRRKRAAAAIECLIRRELPLDAADLVAVAEWYIQDKYPNPALINPLVRAFERFVSETPPDEPLLAAMRGLASEIRSQDRKTAAKIDELCAAAPKSEATAVRQSYSPAMPAPVGTRGVLDGLKSFFGMLADDSPEDRTIIGPDNFSLPANSPLQKEHEFLNPLLSDRAKFYTKSRALAPGERGRVLLAAADRDAYNLLRKMAWRERSLATHEFADFVLHSDWQLPREGLFDVLLYLAVRPRYDLWGRGNFDVTSLIPKLEAEAASSPLTEGERFVLSLVRASLIDYPPLDAPAEEINRLSRLINDGACLCLVPGEAWSDAVNDMLSRAAVDERQSWLSLFRHMLAATTSKPTSKWIATASRLVEALGGETVAHALAGWLALVDKPPQLPRISFQTVDTRDLLSARALMNEQNIVCLRGLLWLAPTLPCRDELLRPVGAVALSAYKKVPGIGARAIKVGNAAIYALSQMASTDAVGQLAMLKVRVKFGTAQKEIEKAFNAAATALNLPRDDIEELGVPSYGLEEDGRAEETFGDYRAELVVSGSDAKLNWFDTKGKALKAVPAKVKSEHKKELKELQQSLKDIQSMLPAQRDRIDSMFLLQKSWAFAVWQERYLDHPLVGTIARRLVWCVDGMPVLFIDGKATDVRGDIVKYGETAEITLWHPVGCAVEEVVAWRRRLEELGITQPFRQAHREIYPLTDAERTTRTYSNRFGAHILRQHQFNALCAARGWKNKLRLMFDEANPPATKDLPQWGLRAEFWIGGIGDDYGYTNESGVYLLVSTDQVRFYRSDAAENYADAIGGGYTARAAGPGTDRVNEPLPLEEIPALVFSEVMRDVDLFVGVASVGNDPTWQDGGPEGRYQTYWQSYSFGELSGTATTRKEVLERLVPRLKIAAQCSFSDRFLVVRGNMRTYKIHLGSGNILMDPNDQYLCVVPDARARATQGDLFLPFEGDNMLSIILSKALLLADDAKLKDPTITRQIKGA